MKYRFFSYHIPSTCQSQNLDYKCFKWFKIRAHISSHTYKLDLLTPVKCHSLFDDKFLKPTDGNLIPDHIPPFPTPVHVSSGEKLVMKEIINFHALWKPLLNLVSWSD